MNATYPITWTREGHCPSAYPQDRRYHQFACHFKYTLEYDLNGKAAVVKGLVEGAKVIFPTVKAARAAVEAHDYARTGGRNPLTKTAKGVYEAADGRIRATWLSAPELRKVMPLGHATVRPGYAIFVDGRYVGCAFDLRDAQHSVARMEP